MVRLEVFGILFAPINRRSEVVTQSNIKQKTTGRPPGLQRLNFKRDFAVTLGRFLGCASKMTRRFIGGQINRQGLWGKLVNFSA